MVIYIAMCATIISQSVCGNIYIAMYATIISQSVCGNIYSYVCNYYITECMW